MKAEIVVRERCAIAFWTLLSAVVCGSSAYSQAQVTSPPDIVQRPAQYLGKSIFWKSGYCFSGEGEVICVGENKPLEVVLKGAVPGNVKATLDENCAGLDAIERNPIPDCRYSFRFVASKSTLITGDYVLNGRLQRNKQIVRFEAQSLEVFK